jgi:tetraacyldisaccharide 4'-kinase
MNPFTGLYGAAGAFRNTLYDRGIVASRRLARPVISIGNLSAGGVGKTPFVIALGQLLQARGVSFDVLSRGYRRKTRGVLVVDPNGAAAEFGDEPLLIARRLHVPVIVGESRYHAGRLAEGRFASQFHVLDDGFQHRSLARDFDIVLMTEDDFRDRLLPAGRLREPLSSLTRANAIVLPKGVEIDPPIPRDKPVWRVERNLTIPEPSFSPVVFCGIARPQQFFAQVRAAGITPAAELTFGDHHTYDPSDVNRLLDARSKAGGDGFLTTEKDAVNLGALQPKLSPLAVAVLNLTLDRPADVVDTILARITQPKPRS